MNIHGHLFTTQEMKLHLGKIELVSRSEPPVMGARYWWLSAYNRDIQLSTYEFSTYTFHPLEYFEFGYRVNSLLRDSGIWKHARDRYLYDGTILFWQEWGTNLNTFWIINRKGNYGPVYGKDIRTL